MFCQKCGRFLQDGEICNCNGQGIPVPPINAPLDPASPDAPVQPETANVTPDNQNVPQSDPSGNKASRHGEPQVPNFIISSGEAQPAGQQNPPQQNAQGQNVPQQNFNPSWTNRAAGSGPQVPPYGQNPQQGYNYNPNPVQNYNYNQNGNPQGGPYPYMQEPPRYYQQAPYMSEDERLKHFKANPKFIMARDFMASPLILLYSLAVTAILLFDMIVLGSYLHPLLILLCVAGWITYFSGVSAKKNDGLPTTAGLSIASGVAITMLVIWCIAMGLTVLLAGLSMVGSMGIISGFNNAGAFVILILLVISILVLVLGIKHYSLQSRALKSIKFCITNEDAPKRISIFPSVILIISAMLQIASTVGTVYVFKSTKILNKIMDTFMEYLDRVSVSKDIRNYIYDYVHDALFSSSNVSTTIISGALSVFLAFITAFIYIKAATALNQFSEF